MSISTLLLIFLILILLGVIPAWPHSAGWGYTPSSGVVIAIVAVLILILLGRF